MMTMLIVAAVFLTAAVERQHWKMLYLAVEASPHKPPAPPWRAHPQLRGRELSPCGKAAAERRALTPVDRHPMSVWQTGWPGLCRGAVTYE